MHGLIRLFAAAIVRPFERLYRTHEGIDGGRSLKISNLNEGLAPIGIGFVFLTVFAVLTVYLFRMKPEDIVPSLPFLAFFLLFAGLMFWLGTKSILWLRIDDSIWLVHIFSVKEYAITDLNGWGFVWGSEDVRQQPPTSETMFLIEFIDGTKFQRIVAPHFAERIATEMNRLTASSNAGSEESQTIDSLSPE